MNADDTSAAPEKFMQRIDEHVYFLGGLKANPHIEHPFHFRSCNHEADGWQWSYALSLRQCHGVQIITSEHFKTIGWQSWKGVNIVDGGFGVVEDHITTDAAPQIDVIGVHLQYDG